MSSFGPVEVIEFVTAEEQADIVAVIEDWLTREEDE
jgi:23S rRNA maturation mini-RNase III